MCRCRVALTSTVTVSSSTMICPLLYKKVFNEHQLHIQQTRKQKQSIATTTRLHLTLSTRFVCDRRSRLNRSIQIIGTGGPKYSYWLLVLKGQSTRIDYWYWRAKVLVLTIGTVGPKYSYWLSVLKCQTTRIDYRYWKVKVLYRIWCAL